MKETDKKTIYGEVLPEQHEEVRAMLPAIEQWNVHPDVGTLAVQEAFRYSLQEQTDNTEKE